MQYPDIYLSGGFALDKKGEKKMLKRSGCKHRCFSAAFIIPDNLHYSKRVESSYRGSLECKSKIMLDSGAFSIHSIQRASAQRGRLATQKHVLSIEELQEQMYDRYLAFLKQEKKFEFFLTLDYVKHQPTIYAVQKKFLKDGFCPVPVFHGDVTVDWLKKYADLGCKLICVGTVQGRTTDKKKRYYLDAVFNEGEKLGLKFHGLARTRLSYFIRWPFKSVDSSSWTKAASYGFILLPPSKRTFQMPSVHVSSRLHKGAQSSSDYASMPRKQREEIQAIVKGYGFDLKKLAKDYSEREVWNAFVFANLPKLCSESEVSEALDKHESTRWESML